MRAELEFKCFKVVLTVKRDNVLSPLQAVSFLLFNQSETAQIDFLYITAFTGDEIITFLYDCKNKLYLIM